jgi:hypothetical protein
MTKFFQTIMGKQFFDATLPRIARSIEALNETVKGLNARLDMNQKRDQEFIQQGEQARKENKEALELLKELVAIKETMEKVIELHTSPLVTVEGQPKLYDEDGFTEVLPDRRFEHADRQFKELLRNSSELVRRACEMAGALQQLLWCDGEDTEHDSNTLGEVANITRRYGFGPSEQLYWSNECGWVSRDSADLFNGDEHCKLNLPMGGEWEPVAGGWVIGQVKELWEDDLIQFARLLCEVQANHLIDLGRLAKQMDLDPLQVNELFDRADAVWERAKKDNCPIPCCGRDHDGDGDCDKHPSLLEQLRARYGMEDLDEHIHEVKAEEAKSINNSSFEEQVSYLRRQCGDAWVKDVLLDGPPPPKEETVQEEADRETDCEP